MPTCRDEFAIDIGEDTAYGKGYGTETTRLMLEYAFTLLGLNSVCLSVAEYNHAGRRACQRAGFHETGRFRQAWLMGGRIWHEIIVDCLGGEFTELSLASFS
jgi:diamine N-acetyltransferase